MSGPRRRPLRVALGVALLSAASPFVLVASASGARCGNFVAIAGADGVRTEVSSPGFAAVQNAEAGAPAAQALVDSVGRSTGFAGLPYPGDTVFTAAALGGVPSSSYPLAVKSNHPDSPDVNSASPGATLGSQSESASSTAAARTSSEEGEAAPVLMASAAASCSAEGTVIATAESTAEGIDIGGVLRVARLHSRVQIERAPGSEPVSEHELMIEGATVAGQPVVIDERGVSMPGAGVPLPALPSDIVASLAAAGLAVTYVAPQATADGSGVTAPTVRITLSRQLVGTGPTEVTYTLGRSFATILGAPSVPRPTGGPAAGGLPSDAGRSSPVLGPTPGATTSATVDEAPPIAPFSRASRWLVSSWSFYPVLVAAAGAVAVSAFWFKKVGVRVTWT